MLRARIDILLKGKSMLDKFGDQSVGLESPIIDAVAVTPNDTTDLAARPRSLWIGGDGDIAVQMKGSDTVVVFKNTFGLMPIRPDRILASGTTATDILALY
jgi:hypothetical protein